MSTILVTGASGFIGSPLCARLVSDGHQVHGVSRFHRPGKQGGIQWWRADVCGGGTVRSLLRKIHPQIIFYLASRVTGSRELGEVAPVFQANLASTVHVLVGAVDVGCERVVLAGSCEEPEQIDRVIPCSPYAAAKWSSTSYARMFQELFHAPVVVPRIFMTYGPGQQDERKVIPYTILSLLRRERPKLSSGKRLVDWIYIDDVVEGLTRAAFASEITERTFDLGFGSRVSIRRVIEQITQLIGNGVEPDFGAIPDRPLEQERVADTSFMERAFGWTPRTSLEEGLSETVKWYKDLRKVGTYVASALWVFAGFWSEILEYQDAMWA